MTLKIRGMSVEGHRFVLQSGGKELESVCKKCGKLLPISQIGFRNMNNEQNEIRLQPWCYACRAKSWKKGEEEEE